MEQRPILLTFTERSYLMKNDPPMGARQIQTCALWIVTFLQAFLNYHDLNLLTSPIEHETLPAEILWNSNFQIYW